MEVVDLTPEHEELFFQCLEDWSDEIKEGCRKKAEWYRKYRTRGLCVKLALADGGVVGGMIQYLPIEESFADGRGLYFITCIWVHGYNKGRGNFQRRGMGTELLRAAEKDERDRGAKGMAAWGLWLPVWMRAGWYKRMGYRRADRDSIRVLVWKPFTDDAEPPRWIRRKKKPARAPGKIAVTSFVNGWCTAQNLVHERARRAAAELGDPVVYEAVDTTDRETLLEWGISDGLFVNGREIRTGPPPSYDKIKKTIAREFKFL
jgi:GNAT superfamily N-acetyltransferase